jgi:alkylhydroperoxidase family enzyme
VDAHLTFLQAAGMPPRAARALDRDPSTAAIDADLRGLVDLAVRVTERPATVGPAEVAAAVKAARSEAEYLDAVGVMVAFNFVNRVANALGVDLEIAPWLRRIELGRFAALRLATLVLWALVDLGARRLAVEPAHENLRRLDELFRGVKLGPIPGFFSRMGGAPQLLEVQRVLLEEGLMSCGGDPRTLMSAGLVVLDQVPARELQVCVARWFQQPEAPSPEHILEAARGAHSAGLGRRDVLVLRFARDVTCCSDRITRERVDELRSHRITDPEILDLVIATAHWNALARLELLLTHMPGASQRNPCNRIDG